MPLTLMRRTFAGPRILGAVLVLNGMLTGLCASALRTTLGFGYYGYEPRRHIGHIVLDLSKSPIIGIIAM